MILNGEKIQVYADLPQHFITKFNELNIHNTNTFKI